MTKPIRPHPLDRIQNAERPFGDDYPADVAAYGDVAERLAQKDKRPARKEQRPAEGRALERLAVRRAPPRRSKYHEALSDPNLNEWVWAQVQQNRDVVNRAIHAIPRLREMLAGRTLAQLYREGILGEFYADITLHAADNPGEYGLRSKEEALQNFGAVPAWHAEMTGLRAEHEATRATDAMAAELAARRANDDKRSPEERAAERGQAVLEEFHNDKGREAADAYALHNPLGPDGPFVAETYRDRRAVRSLLASGRITLAEAWEMDQFITFEAMKRGELRPYAGSKGQMQAAAAQRAEEEKAAYAAGQLPPPLEHYLAGPDGRTPVGVYNMRATNPAAARRIESMLSSTVGETDEESGVRVPSAVTLEEQNDVTNARGGTRRDAARLAVAHQMWQAGDGEAPADVLQALEDDALEREARNERFKKKEPTSRDYVEASWDSHVGTGREALRHEADVSLARDEERIARTAAARTYEASTPAPEPERPAQNSNSDSPSRAAAARAYDAVIHSK